MLQSISCKPRERFKLLSLEFDMCIAQLTETHMVIPTTSGSFLSTKNPFYSVSPFISKCQQKKYIIHQKKYLLLINDTLVFIWRKVKMLKGDVGWRNSHKKGSATRVQILAKIVYSPFALLEKEKKH